MLATLQTLNFHLLFCKMIGQFCFRDLVYCSHTGTTLCKIYNLYKKNENNDWKYYLLPVF